MDATANDLDGKRRREELETDRVTGEDMIPTTQRGTTSPRKKLKVYDSHEDRLSNLPDCVISHILSRLYTEDAVATSLLSRSWRYKWASIYDINLSLTGLRLIRRMRKQVNIQSFRSFMNRMLLSNDQWRIQSFRLVCAWYHSQEVEEWTTAVIRRGVQNLQILTPFTDSPVSQGCFSSWTSLTELKLNIKCTLGVKARNCLSSLKSLSLMNGVEIRNEESQSTSHVQLIFPVLEVLELKTCKWIDIDSVEIEAPKLISFTSHSYRVSDCKFLLNAPAVTYADLDHPIRCHCFALWACTMLKGFHNLRRLKLSDQALEVLVKKKPMLDFSSHARLEELEICSGSVYIEVLMEFLHLLPSLQSISLNMKIAPPWPSVQAAGTLPLCIRSHLKKFIYTRGDGEMSEFDLALAELILKNAKNLQMVIVAAYEKGITILQHQFSKIIHEGSSFDFQTKRVTGVPY